jgi:hypothetical protein
MLPITGGRETKLKTEHAFVLQDILAMGITALTSMNVK